jgi:hypothetical protein
MPRAQKGGESSPKKQWVGESAGRATSGAAFVIERTTIN